ncbi:hypothetical protein [Roseimaritima ulvae]|uniref:Uncharacterized protein n=1 Tax=Roseimaritima ulvae TaxID=980254 RepID=A0A5B9RA99_9BACT|nr:hypothetical protein [Roseimaritima ulvae]QEG43823.1 hypothetical protein UC8_58800 [Roseimaritima ulvae]
MSKIPGKNKLLLLLWVCGIALVWLVVLPRHAQQPAMREHLQWLDEQGIDPSAMYYTELEVMQQILQRRRAEELEQNLDCPQPSAN